MKLLDIIFYTVLAVFLFCIAFLIFDAIASMKEGPKTYGYIDLLGNEGRAYSCTQVRSGFQCYSEKGSMIRVMEYWEIYE